MGPYRIIPATRMQAAAFVHHINRHFAESGVDGDFIFHPMLDLSERVFEEELAKTLDRWKLYPPESGWEKAWLVVDDDERVLGHGSLRAANTQASSHRCVLGIGLEREVRKLGFGRRLMQTMIDWAEEDPDLEWIDLYVFSHNAPARRMYEAFGFREIGEVKDLFRVHGKKVDDIHMVRALGVPLDGKPV